MPAYAEEIEAAEKEVVLIRALVAPVEILHKNGRVRGVVCTSMTLGEFDSSGRRRPIASGKSDLVMEAVQVMIAIGQAVDPQGIVGESHLHLKEGNFIEVDSMTGQT
jgi:NADH-quinone oxidoreductase subunit F